MARTRTVYAHTGHFLFVSVPVYLVGERPRSARDSSG